MVLEILVKNQLTKFRNETTDSNYPEMHQFISDYIASLKDFFTNCKDVIERAKTETKFFKIFAIWKNNVPLVSSKPFICPIILNG